MDTNHTLTGIARRINSRKRTFLYTKTVLLAIGMLRRQIESSLQRDDFFMGLAIEEA